MKAPGTANRATRLPAKYSPLVVGLGPSAVAMVSGTSGRRSPTWMVMLKSPSRQVETADRLAVCRPQALPAAQLAGPLSLGWLEQPTFLSGKLLLAMPGMADPRFERAVIAMCVHDENGAVGIGIGHKRAGISFRGLLRQLDIEPGEAPDCAVHHGGPVEPGRGFVLHSTDWGGQDTLQVNGDEGRAVRDDRHDRRAARDRRRARARRAGSRRSAMPAGARASSTRK